MKNMRNAYIALLVMALGFSEAIAQVTLVAKPTTGSAPVTVTFTATCATCLAYTWDFGDGSPAPLPPKSLTQIHTYKVPGVYTAIFAGTDKNGAPLNGTANVTVQTGEDNMYCGVGNVWIGGTIDGPAALPKACFNTALASTPSPGAVIPAQPQKFQLAYNSAKCGDTISLKYGQTWNGPFTFPSKNCDDQHWITITSDGALPMPGTRANKADAPQMARLYQKQGISVWGDHIRFIGIEWAKQPGGIMFLVAQMHGANKIIFDRNYIHGNPKEESQHGIVVNTGKYIAVVDSYLSEFHCIAKTGACVDSQAISGGTGLATDPVSKSGPVKIVNNYIEASTENILFGGAAADGPGPNDVEIRRNYMFKPMTWNPSDPSYGGVPYVVKNCFELKNGTHVLFEGNVCENNWSGYSQRGMAILLTPKNQAGPNGTNLCPNCSVTDTTIRYSYISSASGFIAIGSGMNDNGAYSQGQHRVSIHDIVIDNLQYSTCFQCSPMLDELGSGYTSTNPPPAGSVLSDVSISNLTMINVGNRAGQPGQPTVSALLNMGSVPPNAKVPQASNISFQSSIVPTMFNGFATTGGGVDNCMNVTAKPATPARQWPGCFVGTSPFTSNVLVGYSKSQTDWPTGNLFAPNFTGMFVNFNGGKGGDYHLVPNSPYVGKGADIDKVNAAIVGVK